MEIYIKKKKQEFIKKKTPKIDTTPQYNKAIFIW